MKSYSYNKITLEQEEYIFDNVICPWVGNPDIAKDFNEIVFDFRK